jgi:hypothetical protein
MFLTKIKISPLIVGIVCLLGIVYLQAQQYERTSQKSTANNYLEEELAQKTQLTFDRELPDFGFNNLRADLTFLQYIQYFGDLRAREEIGYSLIPEYFAAIVDRDTKFTEAYLSLITANSLYAGEPQTTVDLMAKTLPYININTNSIKNIPELWSQKGLDELLLLGNIEAAKKSYQMSVYSASQVHAKSGKELSKDYWTTLEFLNKNPDTKAAQILAWTTVLSNIKEPKKRQEIINKINTLKQESVLLDSKDK